MDRSSSYKQDLHQENGCHDQDTLTMAQNQEKAARLGIGLDPRWFLPSDEIDPALWPVVACDQFTAQPDFWERVFDRIDRKPSTGHIIFPEVYLENPDGIPPEVRIDSIHRIMEQYLDRLNVLREYRGGVFLTKRRTSTGKDRLGVVCAVDLDHYDFHPGNTALIRASEATVESRIPPRLAVRRGAPLESAHILLLIDDPSGRVVPSLAEAVRSSPQMDPAYDVELTDGAGHLTGWHLPAYSPLLTGFLDGLAALPLYTEHGMLFAVGDGNHSLATAKAYWEELKKKDPSIAADHPARFAMVEIEALNDPGLDFEPIHQVVFGAQIEAMEEAAARHFGQGFLARPAKDEAEWSRCLHQVDHATRQRKVELPVQVGGEHRIWTLAPSAGLLTIQHVRGFLDDWLTSTGLRTDYIHGEDALSEICQEQDGVGLFYPRLDPSDFFEQIIRNGILPRKTFSLGHAIDKRFYMECRALRPAEADGSRSKDGTKTERNTTAKQLFG